MTMKSPVFMRSLIFATLFLSICTTVLAEDVEEPATARPEISALVFDQPLQEFHPTIDETQVTAEFTFTNTADKPVTITDIDTGCGCTTADAPEQPIQPGEKKSITIEFNFTARGDVSTRGVVIYTDEENTEPVQVTIKVYIPQLLIPTQRYVTWSGESKPVAQTIELKVGVEQPVNITDIQVKPLGRRSKKNNDQPVPLIVELRQVESDAADYHLIITPRDTSKPVACEIKLVTDYQGENRKNYLALYAHILAVPPKRDK